MARGCKAVQRTSSIFLVNSGTNCTWVIFHTRRWVVKTARIGNFLCYQPDNCTNRRVLVLQSWFRCALGVTTMASRCFLQLRFWIKLKGRPWQISLIFIDFCNCFWKKKKCNSLNFQEHPAHIYSSRSIIKMWKIYTDSFFAITHSGYNVKYCKEKTTRTDYGDLCLSVFAIAPYQPFIWRFLPLISLRYFSRPPYGASLSAWMHSAGGCVFIHLFWGMVWKIVFVII